MRTRIVSALRVLCFILAILAPVPLAGQSDSIYRTVFTNKTTVGRSAPLSNIGQSQHVLMFVAINNGGTCIMNGGGLDLYLESSFDGINYAPITPKRIQAYNYAAGVSAPPYTGIITANGIYPYVRVALSIVYPQCSYTVYYSGSKGPSPYPQSVTASSSGFSTVSVPSITIGATPTVIISPTAPGASPVDNSKILLYFLSVTGAAAGTITFQYYPTAAGGLGSACSGVAVTNLLEVHVPANGSYVASGFMAPVLAGPPNYYLCAVSTSLLSYSITYRVE